MILELGSVSPVSAQDSSCAPRTLVVFEQVTPGYVHSWSSGRSGVELINEGVSEWQYHQFAAIPKRTHDAILDL